MRLLAGLTTFAVAALGFHSTVRPLSAAQQQAVVGAHEWHAGCPVSLSDLRVLTVTYHGFDSRTHTGQLVVNRAAVTPLRAAFGRLYELNFPIRHMSFTDTGRGGRRRS